MVVLRPWRAFQYYDRLIKENPSLGTTRGQASREAIQLLERDGIDVIEIVQIIQVYWGESRRDLDKALHTLSMEMESRGASHETMGKVRTLVSQHRYQFRVSIVFSEELALDQMKDLAVRLENRFKGPTDYQRDGLEIVLFCRYHSGQVLVRDVGSVLGDVKDKIQELSAKQAA